MRPTGPQMSVQKAGGDKHGEGGEAGVFAVDAGLDVVGGNDFKQDEDAEDFGGLAPSRKDGEREQRWA